MVKNKPGWKFPSEYGFTEFEQESLSRIKEPKASFVIPAVIILIGIIISLIFIGLYKAQLPITPVAEAAVPTDNTWYCTELMEGNFVANVQTFDYCKNLVTK